jgi:hypothetical protein
MYIFKSNQQYATLHNVLISVNALHVSGGSSAHHQELKTVYEGDPKISGIVTKMYLKYSYKFETLVPFKVLPL